MEETTHLWKEEFSGNRVQHDEAAVHRESAVKREPSASERTPDQGDLAQHRTLELLGVCSEVTFSTEPIVYESFLSEFR